MICEKCKKMVGMDCITISDCVKCGYGFMSLQSPPNRVCENCSNRHKLCEGCGKTIVSGFMTEYPLTPEEAFKTKDMIPFKKLQDRDFYWYWIPNEKVDQFEKDCRALDGKDYMDCPYTFDEFNGNYAEFKTGGDPDNAPKYYTLIYEEILPYLPHRLRMFFKSEYSSEIKDCSTTNFELAIVSNNMFKPILFPLTKEVLSDIYSNVDNFEVIISSSEGYFATYNYSEDVDSINIKEYKFCPLWLYKELIKRKIDVYNLIKRGLAVDGNTIEPEKRTSAQWYEDWKKENKMEIYDNDGWRDGTCDFEKDMITKEEFTQRIVRCSLIGYNEEDSQK